MKRIIQIGIIMGVFNMIILLFTVNIIITIPVFANNSEDEIHTEEFGEMVQEQEEVFEEATITELESEIDNLVAKYQNGKVNINAKQIVNVYSKTMEKIPQSYNNPQEYYTEEDLAKLEALNNNRADLIMEVGVIGGAKTDDEFESSKPIGGYENTMTSKVNFKIESDSKVTNFKSSNKWSYYGWNGAGDIFIQTYTTLRGVVGDFGHAALGGDNPSTTIEAPGPGKKVQWFTNKWFNYNTRTGQLTAKHDNGAWAWYRVYGASNAKYQAAKNYAHNKILNAPYPDPIWQKFYHPDLNAWEYHCGEVVHFAWLRGAGLLVSNSKDNRAIGPYGFGPQNIYGATYRYRGDLSSKANH